MVDAVDLSKTRRDLERGRMALEKDVNYFLDTNPYPEIGRVCHGKLRFDSGDVVDQRDVVYVTEYRGQDEDPFTPRIKSKNPSWEVRLNAVGEKYGVLVRLSSDFYDSGAR